MTSSIPTLRTGHAHSHPEPLSGARYSAVELMPGDRAVLMLDQRLLPREERYSLHTSVAQVAEAIRTLEVRGAPAIGVAAAYGMVLAAGAEPGDAAAFTRAVAYADETLRSTRPTAVNLMWGLDRMARVAAECAPLPYLERVVRMAAAARDIHREDVAACRRIGALGAPSLPHEGVVLTHCNAGALATGGYGTALGVIRAALEAGKHLKVYAAETRPVWQGARLTAWELSKDGIPVTVVPDTAVAQLFARGRVQAVVVGADRIARSGDVANKIGTYGVACLAHLHGVPFYVAAPWSTVDMACPDGAAIPIEERSPREVQYVTTPSGDFPIVPEGVPAENPAFDVTPARLVRAIFTERGVVTPVGPEALSALA